MRGPCHEDTQDHVQHPLAVARVNEVMRKWSIGCTSFNGFAWRSSLKNSMIVPLSIHGDTMEYSFSFIVAPINSNMLGWDRRFQVITSRKKFCNSHQSDSIARGRRVKHLTFLIVWKSSNSECCITLIATHLPPSSSSQSPASSYIPGQT